MHMELNVLIIYLLDFNHALDRKDIQTLSYREKSCENIIMQQFFINLNGPTSR